MHGGKVEFQSILMDVMKFDHLGKENILYGEFISQI